MATSGPRASGVCAASSATSRHGTPAVRSAATGARRRVRGRPPAPAPPLASRPAGAHCRTTAAPLISIIGRRGRASEPSPSPHAPALGRSRRPAWMPAASPSASAARPPMRPLPPPSAGARPAAAAAAHSPASPGEAPCPGPPEPSAGKRRPSRSGRGSSSASGPAAPSGDSDSAGASRRSRCSGRTPRAVRKASGSWRAPGRCQALCLRSHSSLSTGELLLYLSSTGDTGKRIHSLNLYIVD